ncbi:MAG: hypothetical protein ACTSQF_03665 [Candidatus Heimdallarchaeaceae archaeon]
MRVSSSLSLLACLIGFLTLLIPVLYSTGGYALTWMDIQETPPLWIFMAATLIVAAHDISWLEGIKFVRKSDIRVFRIILIAIAIGMAYAMELSVNVRLTYQTFWQSALYFDIPNETNVLMEYSILYYNMQIVQVTDITFKSTLVSSVFSPTSHIFVFQSFAGLGYHLMRACRVILIFAFISAFLERSLRISRVIQNIDVDQLKKTKP